MTLDEWEPISKRLFGSFPATNITPTNIAAYFADLERFDTRDVEAAAATFRTQGGDFPPSLPVLVRQIETERTAREHHDRLPDFTGSTTLPPAELQRRIEAGERISASISNAGEPVHVSRALPEATKEGE